jgi:hypothetical protein
MPAWFKGLQVFVESMMEFSFKLLTADLKLLYSSADHHILSTPKSAT